MILPQVPILFVKRPDKMFGFQDIRDNLDEGNLLSFHLQRWQCDQICYVPCESSIRPPVPLPHDTQFFMEHRLRDLYGQMCAVDVVHLPTGIEDSVCIMDEPSDAILDGFQESVAGCGAWLEEEFASKFPDSILNDTAGCGTWLGSLDQVDELRVLQIPEQDCWLI